MELIADLSEGQVLPQLREREMVPPQVIPTVEYPAVMDEEFLAIYNNALGYSRLQVHTEISFRNIPIYGDQHLHELYTKGNAALPHLVLLHGFGGSSLTFIRTFQDLRERFQVHALDTFGVGLSSRGGFRDNFTFEEARDYFVDSLEEWRKAVGIKDMVLCGHSFGGYIASLYMEKYPHNVTRLILLSPAGASETTDEEINAQYQESSFLRKIFICFAQRMYNYEVRPSRIMRMWFVGKTFINRILTFRLRLIDDQKECWKQYMSKISVIENSSETGFYKLLRWPVRAVRSIQRIINEGDFKVPIQFLFGNEDWMNRKGPVRLIAQRENVSLTIVPAAGHQLIFDNPASVTASMIGQ